MPAQVGPTPDRPSRLGPAGHKAALVATSARLLHAHPQLHRLARPCSLPRCHPSATLFVRDDPRLRRRSPPRIRRRHRRRDRRAFLRCLGGSRDRGSACDAGGPGEADSGRQKPLNPKSCRRGRLATRPEELPQASSASSAVVQQLPKRCPNVFERLPREPRRGPIAANSGRYLRRFGRRWQTLANIGQFWLVLANFGQCRPSLSKTRTTIYQFESSFPFFGQLRPKSVKLGHMLSAWPIFFQFLYNIGQHRPTFFQ